MIKKRQNGIYHMYINGKPIELCIDGDAWEQIDTFHKIEKYAKSHHFDIKYKTMPTEFKARKQDALSAGSDRYDITIFKLYASDTTSIFFAPKYRVQIHDKHKKQTKTYMGTIAGFMFEMFENIRGNQK